MFAVGIHECVKIDYLKLRNIFVLFAANSVVELQRWVSQAGSISIRYNRNSIWNAITCKRQPSAVWDVSWSVC